MRPAAAEVRAGPGPARTHAYRRTLKDCCRVAAELSPA
jgi:hypothetical protein